MNSNLNMLWKLLVKKYGHNEREQQESYLAQAVDLGDLERRVRALDRADMQYQKPSQASLPPR